MKILLFFVFCALCGCNALILDQDSPRHVTKILSVTNGGPWGDWHTPEYCADGTYANGYNLKIEGNQNGGDDTALNAIQLACHSPEGGFGGDINSGQGQWGQWIGLTSCPHNDFLVAFKLRVEKSQGDGDDTAANFVDFQCRGYEDSSDAYELSHLHGHGPFGTFGDWSETCPQDSAVCGIQTKIEKPQGFTSDDTALNNVRLLCCSETKNVQ